MQLQMPWAESLKSWMQEPWSPSWTESLQEWQKEQMLMTWQWLRLMKRYIDKSGKLQYWLELPRCGWTYMWLIGCPPNMKIQYLRLQLSRSLTEKYRIWNTCSEMMQILRREKLSFEGGKSLCSTKEPSTITTHQLVNQKKFVVCGPHRSLSSCHEWMTLRCCTLGSAVNSVPATWPVLVAQNDHAGAEGNQQLQAMWPAWRYSYQSCSATHHCYAPLELLHIEFTSIETTMELDQPPNVVNILIFGDYFKKHLMAYVTPNQTAKTIAKFLWQGYILIFRAPAKLLSDWGANF